MSRESLKSILIRIVEENTGIKAVELATKFTVEVCETAERENPSLAVDFDFPQILQECIQEGHIKELEYILPDSDYKIRSILFPRGTEFYL